MIENANNKSTFSNDIISKAEPHYSIERFQALEDEWAENYGQFAICCEFIRGIQNAFTLKSVNESAFAEIYIEEKPVTLLKGDLKVALLDWKSNQINFIAFQKKLFYILFRIGILGIKKGPTYPIAFYFTKEVLIDKTDISNSSRFYVHPSLYSFYKVNVLDQLPEE
jgi:hypothetical protein